MGSAAACIVSLATLTASPAGAAVSKGPVDLVWVDPTGAAPGTYESARAETTSLLEEAGLTVRWREAVPSTPLRADEIAVVVMRAPAVRTYPGHLVLGASQRGSDSVSAVWLYALEVGEALGLRGGAFAKHERDMFGRALGRVAAHEVVHAVLPRRPHARWGLMAENVGRSALRGPRPRIDPGTREALLARTAQEPEPTAGSTAELPAAGTARPHASFDNPVR